MKIACVSNFNEETYAESFVAEGIKSEEFASTMCEALIKKFSSDNSPIFFRVVSNDYRLSRGMEDLI